ncbi:hypothetical protein [Lacrimispora amygdalina]|uniref:hypothetical protein n=1 Tax=Lacrimispora amygdalina TaxID=253257 RepID=UPI000BE335E5|nr:hypothetical protein [Lacrimispora amygdalina]
MKNRNKAEHYKTYFPDIDLQSISDDQIEIWYPRNFNMQIIYFLNYLYSYKNRESEFVDIKVSYLRSLLFVDLYDLNSNNKWIDRHRDNKEQQFYNRITYLKDDKKFILYGSSSKIKNGCRVCITPKGADYISEKSIVVNKNDIDNMINLVNDIKVNQMFAKKEHEKQLNDIINLLNVNNKKSPADIINLINTGVSLITELPTAAKIFLNFADSLKRLL